MKIIKRTKKFQVRWQKSFGSLFFIIPVFSLLHYYFTFNGLASNSRSSLNLQQLCEQVDERILFFHDQTSIPLLPNRNEAETQTELRNLVQRMQQYTQRDFDTVRRNIAHLIDSFLTNHYREAEFDVRPFGENGPTLRFLNRRNWAVALYNAAASMSVEDGNTSLQFFTAQRYITADQCFVFEGDYRSIIRIIRYPDGEMFISERPELFDGRREDWRPTDTPAAMRPVERRDPPAVD